MQKPNEMMEHNFTEKDWNQINATIKMLTVATGQIDLSLKVGDKSVDVVGAAFEELLAHVGSITSTMKEMTAENFEDKKHVIKILCEHTEKQTQSFIVAFQFYDELSQRMNHVASGLSGLSELISDKEKFKKSTEWKHLKESIREKYTIQSEIDMFDAVMKGESIIDALKVLLTERPEVEEVFNDVEMF